MSVMPLEIPLAEFSQSFYLHPHFLIFFESAIVNNRIFLTAIPLYLPLSFCNFRRLLNPQLQFLKFDSPFVLKHYIELELAIIMVEALL